MSFSSYPWNREIYKKNTQDRKPGSGMIKKAVKKWNIDINNSFMIGDRKKDLLSAKGAGVKFYYKSKKEKFISDKLKEVVKNKITYFINLLNIR